MLMANVEVRGNCISAVLGYLEQAYDAERRRRVVTAIPPEAIAAMNEAQDKGFYPASYFCAGLQAVAETSSSLEEARREVINVGNYIASASIASFMRLIMKMMTPKLLAHKLPDFFAKDFRNTRARLIAEVSQAGEMKVSALDFAELPYVACAAVGWVRTGLEGIGCRVVAVDGPSEHWNLPEDQFIVRWQT
jgi:hypothetical protein